MSEQLPPTSAAPPTQGVPATPEGVSVRRGFDFPETGALLLVLGALIAFFSIRSQYFFDTDNFINILIAVAVVGVVACPSTMLLIAGQFDLSVGSGVALVSTMFAYYLVHGQSTGVAVLIAMGCGLGIGLINGFLVTVLGINALITTLGTLAALRGLAQIRSDGQAIGFNGFTTLGLDRPLLNIPWMVWIFLAVVILTVLVMRYTTYGRALFAIGANPTAARLAGIRVGTTIFIGFVISGICIGLTGLLLASQTGQGSGNAAIGLELSAVTAVILGGASLAGGRGTILGTMLGVVIIGVINNGLVLLNIVSFWQDVIRGILLVAAVGFDQLRLRLTSE
jgi:ribose transport system permease protein